MADTPDFNKLMKEAQKMQEKMQSAQQELQNLIVTGEAGAGMVKIDISGNHSVKKVTLSKSLEDEDLEMIEDLVQAAINDALQKVEKASKEKIAKLTAGLNLPTDATGGEQ